MTATRTRGATISSWEADRGAGQHGSQCNTARGGCASARGHDGSQHRKRMRAPRRPHQVAGVGLPPVLLCHPLCYYLCARGAEDHADTATATRACPSRYSVLLTRKRSIIGVRAPRMISRHRIAFSEKRRPNQMCVCVCVTCAISNVRDQNYKNTCDHTIVSYQYKYISKIRRL